MSQKQLTSLDLTHLELLNLRFQQLATAPSSPAEGWTYWDTVGHALNVYNGSGWIALGAGGGGGSGTVTSVSVVTANGFAGTVASPTGTPAITITTTVTGLLKGNGNTISAAASGIDYAPATNGTNGQALTSNGAGGFGAAVTLGTVATLAIDTDGTLAANSDTRVASQKAVKTYVANAVAGVLSFQGSTDCSANPNYPVATKGQAWVVSVAGKIGGASGTPVDAGDVYFATADNAGGTQASVGASWDILEHNLQGALLAGNNLSDLASASTARANLGLGASAVLGIGNGLTSSGGNLIVDTAVTVRKYAATIGDGSSTNIAVTHSLGTKDITVSVRDAGTDAFVGCDITANSTTQVTLTFAVAPASNALRVVVHG